MADKCTVCGKRLSKVDEIKEEKVPLESKKCAKCKKVGTNS